MAEVKLGKDAITLPVGTEAGRPANPVTGMIRWNIDADALEGYNGVEWAPISSVPISATGGTISDVTIGGIDYRIHAFTSTGTSTFEVISLGTTDGQIDILVVGGGGSGGMHHGGGGGAGGLVHAQQNINPGAFTITVGDGGDGVFTSNNTTIDSEGNPGQDSSFDGFLGRGGGGGFGWRRSSSNLANGGSGGGATNWSGSATGGSATQPGTNPSAIVDAGHDGSDTPSTEDFGGGGGGAGGPAGGGHREMDGGPGLDFSSIFGTSFGDDGWFAGGGGAGNYRNPGTNTTETGFGNGGPNEKGGGGRGGVTIVGNHDATNESGTQGTGGTISSEIDGIDGTGGGGGGIPSYDNDDKASGFGGSGIVLIRYRI